MMHGEKGDYDLALKYFNEALNIMKELQNLYGMATNYFQIGLIFKKKGDLSLALQNLEFARQIYDDLDKKDINVIVQVHIAFIKKLLNNSRK